MIKAFYAFLLISCTGCGLAFRPNNSDYKIARYNGFEPIHYTACGPQAVHELFTANGIEAPAELISRDILKHRSFGGLFNNLLGVFSFHGMEITWPNEITWVCKTYGFEVDVVEGHERIAIMLGDQRCTRFTGIVLIRKAWDPIDYHYMAVPNINVFEHYEARTKYVKLWIVTRINNE